MHPTLRPLPPLVYLALAACDPGWAATGSVETVPPGSEAPTRVEGARVRIECPEMDEVVARTNRDGEFRVSELGFLDDACVVVVSHPGLAERRFSLDEVCRHRWRVAKRRCHSLEVDVRLDPS